MTPKAAANKYIPTSDNRRLVTYKEGTTGDIIKEVLSTYQHCKNDLTKFVNAAGFVSLSPSKATAAIWDFVHQNIKYKIDPIGKQYIKTPARIWQDKECDCKGYAIFIATALHGLGIPHTIRFVSFNSNDDTPTHVYVIVPNGSRYITMDCVMPAYNAEKPYSSHKDFNMTEISRLSGISTNALVRVPRTRTTSLLQGRKFGEFKLPSVGCTCEQAIDTALLLQKLETEMKVEMQAGKWTDARQAHYQDAIKHCKELIKSYEAAAVAGIFDELKRVVNSGTRTGIVAALQKPEIAYCFLYGFIPDGPFAQNKAAKDHMSQLPAAFRQKKAKQVQLYQWIVSTYKLRDPEFWAPIRATLTTFFGMSPEAFLNSILHDNIQDREAVITGIGFLDDLLQAGASLIPGGGLVTGAAGIFSNLFGKKAGTVASELGVNIPSNLALDDIKPGDELAAYLPQQNSNNGGPVITPPVYTPPLYNPIEPPKSILDLFTITPDPKTEGLALYARFNQGDTSVKRVPYSNGSYDYFDIVTGKRYNIDSNLNVTTSTRTDTGDPYTDGYKELDNVIVTPPYQLPETQASSMGSPLMLAAFAVAALLLLKKK